MDLTLIIFDSFPDRHFYLLASPDKVISSPSGHSIYRYTLHLPPILLRLIFLHPGIKFLGRKISFEIITHQVFKSRKGNLKWPKLSRAPKFVFAKSQIDQKGADPYFLRFEETPVDTEIFEAAI